CLNRYGGINPTYWADMRDGVYGLLLRYTESMNRRDTQAFYMGLMMNAVIIDWQVTHDVRGPYVIKRALDRLYANYDASSHTQMWNPGADGGPDCTTTALW